MLDKIKGALLKLKNKKIIFYVAGFFISLCLVYVFLAQPGILVRESFQRAFIGTHEVRTIQIYSGGELISTYSGKYNVEQYQGYIVIINYDTGERIDIYGDTAIVINFEGQPPTLKR